MSLTTHVLDTATGKPAAGIPVELFLGNPDDRDLWTDPRAWLRATEIVTDDDGRGTLVLGDDIGLSAGGYRLRFHLQRRGESGAPAGARPFYPFVDITVDSPATHHLHIPLLLSPFGYTTYRGS